MQISARFAEYGITGAFFWMCQFVMLLLTAPVLGDFPPAVNDWFSKATTAPQLLQTLVAGVLGTVGIISVFVTGLLLDLLGGYFVAFEMAVFKKHIQRNEAWLEKLINEHRAYAEADLRLFMASFQSPLEKDMWLNLPKAMKVWTREGRRLYVDGLKKGWGTYRLLGPYTRLWSFFLSHVLILSGSSQLNILIDQVHLWRTGRAISTALMIVFIQAQIVAIYAGFPSSGAGGDSLWRVLLIAILPLIVTVGAMLITVGAYSRMCYSLFSLTYMSLQKVESSRSGRAPQGGDG